MILNIDISIILINLVKITDLLAHATYIRYNEKHITHIEWKIKDFSNYIYILLPFIFGGPNKLQYE